MVNRCLPPISYLTSLVRKIFLGKHSKKLKDSLLNFKDKYSLGSMALLIVVCVWHAIVSVIDNEPLYLNFLGYAYLTLEDFNHPSNATASDVRIYFDSHTNTTMVRKSLITVAERSDRIALIILIGVNFMFHIFFGIWMYLSVNESRIYRL